MSEVVDFSEPVFTVGQKREIALKYVNLKRGQKGAYASSLGLTCYQIRCWISAMADGDLGNSRFPRKIGTVTSRDIQEVQRLQQCLDEAQGKIAHLEQRHVRELAAKDAQILKLEKASDSLGKAIAALHSLCEERAKAENS